MGSYTPTLSTTHQTLAAATVDTVTFAADFQRIEILNRDTAADIYFVVGFSAPTPVVLADGTFVVQAGQSMQVDASDSHAGTTVKLISAGAAAYSITGSN